MMRAAARSVANLCIFTMQDILCLGSEARMNTPANRLGNWSWRYETDAITPEMAEELAELMEMTDRDEVEAAKEKLNTD
jgi:4-alpha-glucanotransferase